MFHALLRYLGLDQETKRVRQEAQQNLALADVQLDQLQKRLEETSQISVTGGLAIRKTLRESDFSGKRRRAVSGGA